ARQAHNLKVIGSNPIPATNDTDTPVSTAPGVFLFSAFPMACRSIQFMIVPTFEREPGDLARPHRVMANRVASTCCSLQTLAL
ncbi:hypothetical protein, partial [Acetobacter indonesiensis]|uniref:hypothetical protein n=1 Tax=Acetobacter indonesiensis TaxID=104101 RepID=UPI0039EC5900